MPKKNSPSEQTECEMFWNWLVINGLGEQAAHIPNEIRTPYKGILAKLKRVGFVSGLPDYLIVLSWEQAGRTAKQGNIILFIEMKRSGATPSETKPAQALWVAMLNGVTNVEARVCRGAEEAISLVSQYLKNPIMFN